MLLLFSLVTVSTTGFTKNSLKEKILMIKIVENGMEQAKILTAKLISKVGFFCSSFSSNVLTALIWANGQKLQALCGNTTINKIIGAANAGKRNTKIADSKKVIPARHQK